MASKRIFLITLVLSVVTALCLTPLFAEKRPALPVLWDIADFKLTNSDNLPMSSQSLRGKVWVADFIFTTCAGPCPVMTGHMSKLQTQFAKQSDVRFVSISVNPEYDTPAILKEYGKAHGADFSRWSFLTGDLETVQKLAAQGFKFGTLDEPIMHSVRFALVDRKGRMRGSYIATDDDAMRRLPADIESLINE